jgi:hypothetical protein
MVWTFAIERMLTVSKATGKGNVDDFIRKIQYHLAIECGRCFAGMRQAKRKRRQRNESWFA